LVVETSVSGTKTGVGLLSERLEVGILIVDEEKTTGVWSEKRSLIYGCVASWPA